MASALVVRRALLAFANNYGKTDQWVDDTLKLWARGLTSVSDKDLIRGTEVWCRDKRRPPNLARLLEVIKSDPTSGGPPTADGCPGCNRTGWRQLARHYTDKNQRPAVYDCLAACDCDMGQRLASGPVPNWHDVLKAWEADPYTERVYHTTAQHPNLTMDERLTVEAHEAIKQRAKHSTSSGSWQRLMKGPA